ncbi:MAG: ion transporter [Planctomycetes bacterium]|nr:ion transporter [Planctomycetota bacterium]
MPTIHPGSRAKRAWDNAVVITAVLACVEAPVRVVLEYPLAGWLYTADLIVTALLLADVFLHFHTGVHEKKQLLTDRARIGAAYLKGWFVVDLLSALPFGLAAVWLGGGLGEVRDSGALGVLQSVLDGPSDPIPADSVRFTLVGVLSELAILRVLRIGRLGQFVGRWKRESALNPSILRLGTMVFWILLATHFIACAWLFLGSGNAAGTNATDFAKYEPTDNARNYLRALYWTTTTIATIGYGDISPVTNAQTIFAMFVELLGAGMYGYIIGAIANLIANIDVAKARHREQMEKIEVFMKYKGIPRDTQEKVRDYYHYLWETRRGYDEFAIVNDFPEPLKAEILLYLNRAMIEKVPIFQGASSDFVREIVLNMKPVVFSPGEFVFRKGEVGHTMFFISRGGVDVVSEDGQTVFATLREGNFFGEIALLLSMPRTASIRAVGYADLYELNKETFDRVLARFPDFEKQIRELARRRHEEITRAKQ